MDGEKELIETIKSSVQLSRLTVPFPWEALLTVLPQTVTDACWGGDGRAIGSGDGGAGG